MMLVSRCICYDQDFEQVLKTARNYQCQSVVEVQEHLAISSGCGLCIPYVQKVIETGEVAMPVMSQEEVDKWSERSGISMGESST